MKRFGLSAVIVLLVLLLANVICFADSPFVSQIGWMGFDIGDTRLSQQPEIWRDADTASTRTQVYKIRAGYQQYTVFAVVRNPDPDSVQWLWSFADNDTLSEAVHTAGIYSGRGGILFAHTPRDFSRWSIYGYHSGCYSDSTKQRKLSIGSIGTFVKDSVIPDTICSNVEMKEMAYYPCLLGRRECDMFMTYLALKYGITLDYAPYLSCYGDTLWHPEHDAPWYHHIIGVGHDTARAWYANQSVSLDTAVFTISVDTLTPGEYILLGDNGASLYPSVQADGSFRVEREWLLHPYVQHHIPVRLFLPFANISDIPQDSLWLQVSDKDGLPLYILMANADEADSQCTFILPTVGNTPLVLTLWGEDAHPSRHKQQKQSDGSQTDDAVWYDAASGNIMAGVQWNGRSLTALLYDSSGKLVSTLSACLPLPVSQIPGNICHVEIVSDGTIVGNIILPANR